MNEGWLDSTEILENLAATWRFTSPLPSARYGLRAASVGNNILVFGENILFYIVIKHRSNDDILVGGYDDAILSDILRYNKRNHTWEEVGQMKKARQNHALGLLEDVSQLCP